MLENDRLIETRRGRAGGSFVLAPTGQPSVEDYRVLEVAQSADLIREAVAYRAIVEPAAARSAARARSQAELAEIARAANRTADADSDAEFMRQDTAFHLAIARAAANRFVLEAIEQTRLHLNAVLALLPDSPTWHDLSVGEHDEILAAIRSRDADAADTLMRAHVERTARSVSSLLKSLEAKQGRRTAGKRAASGTAAG